MCLWLIAAPTQWKYRLSQTFQFNFLPFFFLLSGLPSWKPPPPPSSSSFVFLRPPLNSLKHGRLNIYMSLRACLMLKAHFHRRVNEWKSFRQNTSSGWWVPGHFGATVPQVQPPFQGMVRQGPRGLLGGSAEKHSPADTAVSLKRGDLCI